MKVYIAEHVCYDYYRFDSIVSVGRNKEKVEEDALNGYPNLSVTDDEGISHDMADQEHILITTHNI